MQITSDTAPDIKGQAGWFFNPETGVLCHLVVGLLTTKGIKLYPCDWPYFEVLQEYWRLNELLQKLPSVLEHEPLNKDFTASLVGALIGFMDRLDPMAKEVRQARAERDAAQEATKAVAAVLAKAVSGEDPEPLTGLIADPSSRTLASQLVGQVIGLHGQCRLAVPDIPDLPDGHLVPDKPRPKKR